MPPQLVKKPAGTPTPKKVATKTPNKTPKSTSKTLKLEPKVVENVEKLEEAAPVEDVKVLEVPAKEEKSIEAGKLKERYTKDAAIVEKPVPLNESAPKKAGNAMLYQQPT